MSAADTAAQEMPTDEATPLGAKHEPPAQATSAALIKRAPLPPAVAQHVLSDDEMRRTWRVSSALAASGMFKDAKQAEQAFAKILIGRDLGISATQSLMTIDIVFGAIQLRGVLLAKFVRQSRDYEYKVLERTNQKCVLLMLGFPSNEAGDELVRHRGQWWEVLSREEFTIGDAQTAGLVKKDSNWQKYPKNMCFWRALSNGVKFEAPDLLGGVPVYTEADEIPAVRALGDGEGDGQPAGINLGPDVEAIIGRAADLGHAALADRGTIEMLLGDQPPAKVAEWVKAARRELDAIPAEAEVIDGEPVSGDVRREDPQVDVPPSEPENGREASSTAGEAVEYAAPTPEEQAAADKLGVPIVSQGFLDDGPPRKAEPSAAPNPERIAALRRRGENLLSDAEDAKAAGNDEAADALFAEFEAVAAQVEAMGDENQSSLAI